MAAVDPTSQKAGWDAVAPLMAAYHQKMSDARAAQAKDDSVKPVAKADDAALSEADRNMVSKLQARDREVRAHEQAHKSVGGALAGGASYTYQAGPDGQRYAIGGEVPIDVAPVEGDPQATIDKMNQVKAAALAPAEPSSADRQIASMADAQRARAVADLAALRRAEQTGEVDQRS
ncbi:putative metalloprotease CJM1_0395 family protein [Sagittula sp. S175]|uniref:putative metalloprotease CJM1_0395 family protein n=1 Tax=Sagittula sp. S175 TaxID=3415129 RepID=UPI003C7D82F1